MEAAEGGRWLLFLAGRGTSCLVFYLRPPHRPPHRFSWKQVALSKATYMMTKALSAHSEESCVQETFRVLIQLNVVCYLASHQLSQQQQ